MADESIRHDDALAPPSEQVHLPGPSLLPVIVGVGITLALVGVVIQPVICVIGLIITVGAVIKWISEVRSEISELPLDHS
ncbi:MAG: hypothetical protein QOG62_1921 [Thermoleophilaceae bacterium]|jgi:hypothetical protein|nr:hypothetical protein [Thermoleophilaceae bacterium]